MTTLHRSSFHIYVDLLGSNWGSIHLYPRRPIRGEQILSILVKKKSHGQFKDWRIYPPPIITIPPPHILPLKEAINNVSVVPQQLLCGHFQCPAPMISTHGELGGKHTTHTNYFDTCHCVSKWYDWSPIIISRYSKRYFPRRFSQETQKCRHATYTSTYKTLCRFVIAHHVDHGLHHHSCHDHQLFGCSPNIMLRLTPETTWPRWSWSSRTWRTSRRSLRDLCLPTCR